MDADAHAAVCSMTFTLIANRKRQCPRCRQELPLSHFHTGSHGKISTYCDSCVQARQQRLTWTEDENERVRKAARELLLAWSKFLDMMTEEDLEACREMVDALDRRMDRNK